MRDFANSLSRSRSLAGGAAKSLPAASRYNEFPAKFPAGHDGAGNSSGASGNVSCQFGEPRRGGAVGRRAPVAARRQRAAGRYLRPVGDGRALELADREEAEQEFFL